MFVIRGRRALLVTLLNDGAATMDDVRDVVTLPADIDPKLFGSVPSALAFAGIIQADGLVKTSRPKAHARPVTVWRLVDRDAAERWLIDHPDRGDELPIGGAVVRSPDLIIDRADAATTQRTLFDEGGRP